MDAKLIAILGCGRAFAVELGQTEQGNLDTALEQLKAGKPPLRSDWLRTQEGFHIRRDAIVALVIGEKEGEWAIARRP